jgi:flagellar export protein FliJ
MSDQVWDVLIRRETARSSAVLQRLEMMTQQQAHVSERIQYLDSLLQEYEAERERSPLQARAYQLQLHRMREKLFQDADALQRSLDATRLSLREHAAEIQKYSKLRVRAQSRAATEAHRYEERQLDEVCLGHFNFMRRAGD